MSANVDDAGVNILLVDDRPDNLLALEAMLEILGQNLVRAYSGEEALRHLLDQEFAVILLDVQMPGMDGFEIARLIKEREKSQHTPIIFITAIERTGDKAFKGYSVGAVDYLLKPIVPEILRAKVSTFIDLFRKTRQAHHQSEWIEALNQELRQTNARLKSEALELEQAHEALQRSASLYRTLAQNAPNVTVGLFDRDL